MPGRASEFTADARDAPRTSVPERADSEAVAGRLVYRPTCYNEAQPAPRRAALGAGPDSTGSSRSVAAACRGAIHCAVLSTVESSCDATLPIPYTTLVPCFRSVASFAPGRCTLMNT